ncbi:alpha/beta fold hydrolase [Agromyces sp. ZXT2-3]|uniref:alpha/beta fold hydrolase n=1 Tax=Agromyces sp. ZXT2-3 TaxID=3461152 RepID=UPI004054FF5A
MNAVVRILIGDKDLAPGPLVAAELVKLFHRALVTVLPGSTHFPWVDQPSAFTAAVAAALTTAPANASAGLLSEVESRSSSG